MRIVNIVTLWDLGKKVKLLKRLSKFNADVIRNGSNCLLLFESGKIIATGFKRMNDVKKFLKNSFPTAKLIKVINMTAIAHIRGKIETSKLNYEPEIFPAYLWKKNKLCVVYYTSGKLVITGGKTYNDLRETFEKFKDETSIKRLATNQS